MRLAVICGGVTAVLTGLFASASDAHAQRRETDLSRGWRFQFGAASENPQTPKFDDNAWARVSVPHTWNRIGEYRTERTSASNNDQGVGWYRLSFRTPSRGPGRRFYLEFDGVGNIAGIWLNGTHVGEHRGAFSRFRFDVTKQLQAGENVLAVRADNSKPAPGSSTESVLPLAGDFFIHGGIYRGVRLIDVDDAHVDLLDFGGPGVYARAVDVSARSANIEVLTRLRNDGAGARNLVLATTVRDARSRIVATVQSPVSLAAEAGQEALQNLTLASTRLWNGRADPHLYSVAVELRDGSRVIDGVIQPLGVRTFRFDANEGFFLNGEYLRLAGVSRHQDRLGRGWALSPADHAEDMRIILEMGANTVRHAHYQHAQEWADEADRAGMVVWAEVPYVSTASFDGSAGSQATFANAHQQTIELIRQNYNHPSIMMWSVGNEVDVGALLFGLPARSLALLQDLAELAREEDPSRATVFADCCEGAPIAAKLAPEMLAGTTDLIGYNRYFGWYYGGPDLLGPAMDQFHAKHPNLPISVSEYGAGGALTQHSDNPEGGAINAFGRPHPEEYQSWLHERSWAQLRSRRYIFAHWIWNMFDFASDLRQEGEAIDLNDKGLVTFDRRTRKDAFYFYRANWSSEPVLHVTGRRYVERAYPVVDVRVYSNAETATLNLNGQSLGDARCVERICVWRNVALRAGENDIRVSARVQGRELSDRVRWIAPDAAAGLRVNAGDLTGHESATEGRFGSDNFFVGGTPRLLNVATFRGGPKAEHKVVQGADEPGLFEAYREGDFGYELPLPDGEWRVRVVTFEPDAALVNSRSFNVSANGQAVLSGVSPGHEAGGALRPAELEFTARAVDGKLRLAFQSAGAPAIVAAIEVSRMR